MLDRRLFLTQLAVRRQLAAMPHDLFLVRLIPHATRRASPGERLWTPTQLTSLPTLRFLRARNREGWHIYFQPYAGDHNAGYILLDLDGLDESILDSMRANGHEPCVVVQTSPGSLQAWLHLSRTPLQPAVATAVSRYLADFYGADRASADWRHVGRLAGFTNQKPERRTGQGFAPWVKVLYTRPGLASTSQDLLQQPVPQHANPCLPNSTPTLQPSHPAEAKQTYQAWVQRWRIAERFPQPDWSIVDLWVARQLLSQGEPAARVEATLRWGSPLFPRRHGNPDDYLRRTLARASFPIPAPARSVCCTVCAARPTATEARFPHRPPRSASGA